MQFEDTFKASGRLSPEWHICCHLFSSKGKPKEKKMRKTKNPEVVVITGASAGVGRAAAQVFAKRGAKIALLARGRDGLQGAKREVESLGGKALVLPTDVSNSS